MLIQQLLRQFVVQKEMGGDEGCGHPPSTTQRQIDAERVSVFSEIRDLFAHGRHSLPSGHNAHYSNIILVAFAFNHAICIQNDFEETHSRKGKTPWITFNGIEIADSQLCLEMLADMFQKDFSSHLSPEHKATARALQIMAYDHLYWYIYYLNIIQLIVFIDNRVRVFIGLAFCGNGSTPKGEPSGRSKLISRPFLRFN